MTSWELRKKIDDARKNQCDVIILSVKEAEDILEKWAYEIWEASRDSDEL